MSVRSEQARLARRVASLRRAAEADEYGRVATFAVVGRNRRKIAGAMRLVDAAALAKKLTAQGQRVDLVRG